MQFKTSTDLIQSKDTPCMVIALTEDRSIVKQISELLSSHSSGAQKNAAAKSMAAGEQLKKIEKSGQFSAKFGEIHSVPFPQGIKTERLVLLGAGKAAKLDDQSISKLLSLLAKNIKNNQTGEVVAQFASLTSTNLGHSRLARLAVEAFGDVFYQYKALPKPKNGLTKHKNVKFTLICQDKKAQREANKGAKIGAAIDSGKTLSKTLANLPGNICTPTYLASQAKSLAKTHSIKTTILSEKKMSELSMGSLLSVSKGSREPAQFIIMEYKGAKSKTEAPHVLVGKGLTFDAGGISIKPSPKMDEMKYDMCGGASVFGTMRAISELKLPINVVGIVPASENLPDGLANKPGDVVTSMAGYTIEILNTDAEGRLILCDALTYAKRFKPKSVIDIATLTGAVIVALGHQTAGLMGNNQKLVDDILTAGETSLDPAWQLPINSAYKRQLKSDYADLANIGGPSAGSITAGCFLSYFAEDFKWAHLDIAGTAWGGTVGKRASGRAVPILTQYLINCC